MIDDELLFGNINLIMAIMAIPQFLDSPIVGPLARMLQLMIEGSSVVSFYEK